MPRKTDGMFFELQPRPTTDESGNRCSMFARSVPFPSNACLRFL